MNLVLAIIRPERLAAVQKALSNKDVHLMTVSEVLDCRQDRGTTEIYRGRTISRPVPKLRLEIAVEDSCFNAAVEAIERAATSDEGCKDDVFVMGLDESVRIWLRGREPVTLGR